MKYIKQLTLILAISFIGELIHAILPFPVPASVYGLLLLFGLLMTKVVKLEQVEDTATYLLAIMPIFFIEPAVGLMVSLGPAGSALPAVLAAGILSTFAVILCTGWGAQAVVRRSKKRKENRQPEEKRAEEEGETDESI